jgi:inhibitor of KinA sporulation pathway (predicted exonuclease)
VRYVVIDQATTFALVLRELLGWVRTEPFIWCSWGAYDLKQLRSDCGRHRIVFPAPLARHINLKREFARLQSVRPPSMGAGAGAGLSPGLSCADSPHRSSRRGVQ